MSQLASATVCPDVGRRAGRLALRPPLGRPEMAVVGARLPASVRRRGVVGSGTGAVAARRGRAARGGRRGAGAALAEVAPDVVPLGVRVARGGRSVR